MRPLPLTLSFIAGLIWAQQQARAPCAVLSPTTYLFLDLSFIFIQGLSSLECPKTLHFDFLGRAHRVIALRNRDHPVDKTGFYYDRELGLIGHIEISS
jgi:hypothetical protein